MNKQKLTEITSKTSEVANSIIMAGTLIVGVLIVINMIIYFAVTYP